MLPLLNVERSRSFCIKMRVTTVKNLLSGSIKSVSESFKCFSPQTPVIFAGDFGTREMLLTATRPQGERIDFISKNCTSEMPFFLLIEIIVKLRIKTSQDGHFEFRR